MDIKQILAARGLNEEQSKALIENPAYASLLEAFITEAESGKTALMKAQEIEQNLKTWNETQVVPYVRGADEKVAKVSAELAATRAHMKALKDAGYDIPDSYLATEATTVTPPAKTDGPSNGIDAKALDEREFNLAKTNMALITLANRHRKLTGDELDLDSEFSDFEKNRRPQENMRDYVARKYDHAGKQAKLDTEREQKKLDDYAAEKIKAAKTEWVAANGPNPETRNPRASRFTEIAADKDRAALWQTRTGRDQATKNRLEKYMNLVQ